MTLRSLDAHLGNVSNEDGRAAAVGAGCDVDRPRRACLRMKPIRGDRGGAGWKSGRVLGSDDLEVRAVRPGEKVNAKIYRVCWNRHIPNHRLAVSPFKRNRGVEVVIEQDRGVQSEWPGAQASASDQGEQSDRADESTHSFSVSESYPLTIAHSGTGNERNRCFVLRGESK